MAVFPEIIKLMKTNCAASYFWLSFDFFFPFFFLIFESLGSFLGFCLIVHFAFVGLFFFSFGLGLFGVFF